MILEIANCEVGFWCSNDIASNLIFTVYTSFSTRPLERWSPTVQKINLILKELQNNLKSWLVKQDAWSTRTELGFPWR